MEYCKRCFHPKANHKFDPGILEDLCEDRDCKCPGFRLGETRSESSTGGQKGVKPERHSLIPQEALDYMARLYGFGAEKYAAHNWRKGYDWSKSYDSLIRHASAFWRGEDLDPETGLPHLAGAAFHCFTLMIFMEEHPEFDDRYKKDIQDAVDKTNKLWDPKVIGRLVGVSSVTTFDPPILFEDPKEEAPTEKPVRILSLAEQVEALAEDSRFNDLQKVTLKTVADTLRQSFCNECQGPYGGHLEKQYGGHWDSCPNRHKFEKKND